METPRVPPSPEMPFRVSLRTRWSDEDTQHVLNNAVLPTLFEEARFAYFSSLGLLEENRFPFVLAQTNVVYLSPGRGGREVEVEMATTGLGTSSFTQAYRVRDAASGDVWCEAESRLVCVDAKGAKRAMDPAFRRAISARENPSC
jgi:acyl-CoA thioesterase FadM